MKGQDGIVCLVTNNSFVDQIAFDGMRKNLLQDFTSIYHLDLHGNVRKNPKLSGTTHNVFGIQVGVGITMAIRNSQQSNRGIYYYRVPEDWRKTEKLTFLNDKSNINGIEWIELQPDERSTWITEGMQPEFIAFMPMGTKEAKLAQSINEQTIFRTYSNGAKTNRDTWVYDFSQTALTAKVTRLIETYNSTVDEWKRRGIVASESAVDSFVTYDDTRIKWSHGLKLALQRRQYAEITSRKVRYTLYRPFCKQWMFFDRVINEAVYQLPQIFPYSENAENVVVCVAGIGDRKGFGCLATDVIPSLDLAFEKSQCFPYYTYAEDGSNRRENITDWALTQFQAKYGSEVTKWDIFHYVYAMLHHPAYRERYAENLKRDLPRLPLLASHPQFEACVRIGKRLMELHLHYEEAREYSLTWLENKDVPINWRVEKMRLNPTKDALTVNDWLTLTGIPQECYAYRLGNRSALEWVIDQYRVSTDARSGIMSDPNRGDDEQYIVKLVGKVVTVSVETVKLVAELAEKIGMDDIVGA